MGESFPHCPHHDDDEVERSLIGGGVEPPRTPPKADEVRCGWGLGLKNRPGCQALETQSGGGLVAVGGDSGALHVAPKDGL